MEQNHLTLKKSTKAIIVVCITFIWLLFNWTSILNSIGTWYAKGDILPQDYKMAVKFFRIAAKYNNANAQYNLALSYDLGRGVRQNNNEAFKWYLKAAIKGQAQAQGNLGYCYEHGEGVEQNDSLAVEWIVKQPNKKTKLD